MSRPYTDVLRDINGGKFAEELTEALAEVVESCAATGKTGSITVVLKLKPAKGSGKVMTIEQDYKVKSPEFDQPQQFFFIANGNTLVADNPDQKKLPFRDVMAERNDVKAAPVAGVDFDEKTGEVLPAAAAGPAAQQAQA